MAVIRGNQMRLRILLPALLLNVPLATQLALADSPATADTQPTSVAETVLFETPHLKTIDHLETLNYRFERIGPSPFVDKVGIRIAEIHPDGTKFVTFNFLTGANHKFYPGVDNFSGNPVLMVFLQHDVENMRDEIGVAATFFRNRIREAFTKEAIVSDTTYSYNGKSVPAKLITLKPFIHLDRFEKLPEVQQKEYRFVISDAVPGEIAEVTAEMQPNKANEDPGLTEKLSFVGETQ
jgi:hypothetical protein